MSLEYRFSYHFYPVGQGLFSAGAIRRYDKKEPLFLWVYDCGTSSSQGLVDNSILNLKFFAGQRKKIDLLTLSHFDEDHINGVVRLLAEFKIGTLMLPYMPLAQRLLIAFEEGSGGVDDSKTNFYLNPVAFFLSQDWPGIDRILLVMPSGEVGPANPGDLQGPLEPEPDNEFQISYDSTEPEDAVDLDSLVQAGQQKNTLVDFLRPGSRITLTKAHWEFIPYNDDIKKEIKVDFLEMVKAERSRLLSDSTSTARQDSLDKLKKAYDDLFGLSNRQRNIISLFLYSGPVYDNLNYYWLNGRKSGPWMQLRQWIWWKFLKIIARKFPMMLIEPKRIRCSILYTGDGYLNTNAKLKKIIKFLNEHRVQKIGVFQVMHHGSKTNWRQGIGKAIAPMFSVFSSDPDGRYRHPHPKVLQDFCRYGAVQVDQNADFTAYGILQQRSKAS